MRDPDYSPEMPGRLGKLGRRSPSSARLGSSTGRSRATRSRAGPSTPYALLSDNGVWYLVGRDLDREDERTFAVSRIRGDIRFATRRERDFRVPSDFNVDEHRGRPPWQIGDIVGEARVEWAATPPGGWSGRTASADGSRTASS